VGWILNGRDRKGKERREKAKRGEERKGRGDAVCFGREIG